MSPTRMLRTAALAAAAAVFALVAIEIASFAFFSFFRDRFTFHDIGQLLMRSEEIPAFAERFDPDLGWDTRFDTPMGERPRTTDYGSPLVATFGDSYTYCSDVEHNETWQTALAARLERDVYNFGVPGFGTDQAYLKYLRVRQEFRTPVVVLGIITENINRVVCVYRPFYFPLTGIRLPKPRFVLEEGELQLVRNPLGEPGDIARLTDEDFVRSLGKRDEWYNRDRHPVFGFPYAKILFNRRIWREATGGRKASPPDDVAPRPWENLWKQEAHTALMFAIIDAFVAAAAADGATPVVLVLPMQDQVFEIFCTGKMPADVAAVVSHCDGRGYHCINTIPAMAASVGRMEEIPGLYTVHVSPRGNRIIADSIHEYCLSRLGM
ncbi:MAG: SGNH/GDSL hydrolase family protein [Candidatus Krumholzibacteriota bacterium]|nr:SGNH/GDSL hydrolase family protein [Candidatus Krumholzibacteriota bacterium]